MATVGRDAVDGALVTLHFPQGAQRVRVPQLENAAPASAQQGRRTGDHSQRTDPVPVGIRYLLSDS